MEVRLKTTKGQRLDSSLRFYTPAQAFALNNLFWAYGR